MARTKGSPLRARSAASWSSSARISGSLHSHAGAVEIGGNVEIGGRGGGPRDFDGLAPMPLHHLFAATVAGEGAQLREERSPIEDGRGDDPLVGRDDERCARAMPCHELF